MYTGGIKRKDGKEKLLKASLGNTFFRDRALECVVEQSKKNSRTRSEKTQADNQPVIQCQLFK